MKKSTSEESKPEVRDLRGDEHVRAQETAVPFHDDINTDMRSRVGTNPIFRVLFLLMAAYLIWEIFSQQQMIEEKQYNLSVVEQQIEAEQQRSKVLEREKELLNSDESLEKIAREKLGMVKPGERVFVDLNR